ncbi:hypothetical protein EV421DRAFT_1360939 [Armillaria borealis]|uniref:Mid2 domain-containing protein n=1 Tax=Armillaria borealis TaxID=47425 RepID=A0AA39J369_9AGAR|nr:hypothetical protein EV421DRAFT_1360939 [Armillaria borealis]
MVGYINNTYDDRLTDVLKYAGSWFNTGTYNASSVGDSGTLSSSNDPTANVTFVFPVPANAFYYYGMRRSRGGLYAICIDCDPNKPIFETIDAVNATDDGTNPPVILFSRSFEQPGTHEIILTNQNDTRFSGGNSQITLDRFVLQVVDNSAPESSTSTSGSSTSSSATSSTAPAASQSTIISSSKPPIGTIVGGVVGGIAAISLCLIIWFFMRRHHRAQQEHNDIDTSLYTSPYQPSPFTLPRENTSTPSDRPRGHIRTPTTYTTTDTTPDHPSRRANGASVATKALASDASSGRARASSSRMASSERLPRRETDAGRIDVDDDDDDFATLPPGYEDIFSGGRPNGEQPVTRGLSRRLPRPEARRPLPLPGEPSGQPSSQPTKF